ncbi:cache domain-containing protein [Methanococcus maripaludis]|uniref:Cache 3/Cache 2 fusion domain-containing protein n=1 Tax=Methanococcus maripaludis TaxID=39152 RepID=A0A7J9PU03_METMI|nr:Cache 3/Cache 2 fusion domain-containing protein [Methanococcus maripaludis]MBA2868918.1 hypothetical protein [Methanococcus maripaludis]
MNEKKQKLVFRTSLLLCILSFVLLIFLGNYYMSCQSQMLDDAKENAKSQADNAAMIIGKNLSKLVTISESLANEMSSGELKNSEVTERLKNDMEENTDLFGHFAAYEPYAFNSEKRLYAPYYVRVNRELELIQIENKYDYTVTGGENGTYSRTAWYHLPFETGACWIEPYLAASVNTSMINYNVVFYNANNSTGEKVPAGIIGTEYSLDGIRNLVGSFDLGNTGYGFIITQKGTIVSHPIAEYLGKNIADLKDKDDTLRQITENITYSGHQVFYNEDTGQNLWVFYEPIHPTEWTLGVVLIEDEISQECNTFQRHLEISLAMVSLTFLFLLSVLIFQAHKGNPKRMWIVASIFSMLCISGMCFVWYVTLDEAPDKINDDKKIFDRCGLEAALNKLYESPKKDMISIPTGIFLQSMEFSSANNVIVTGYLWQNYSGIPEDISRGFVFPEAESIEVEEAYREDSVIGWHFRAVLRQPFDYSKYPFDREDVWIRIWHKDFQQNIILVPDLESYDMMNPDSKPGLEKNFVIEGWDIQDSFFSYRTNTYNLNFGVEEYQQKFPELYYNVGLKRDFVSSMISDLIPLVVVAILLFAVLIISTKSDEKIQLYGFSSSTVLAYCAALFFVLIVSQVSLRDKLAAAGIIYLEYFYFILYIVILGVSINSILLASNSQYRLIHYGDNLIIKILYWPFILGSLLLITLIHFY